MRRWDFGGLGGAGVSVGADERGEMMLFIASGGAGELGARTTGILAAFGLPSGTGRLPAPEDVGGGIELGGMEVNAISLVSLGIAVVAVVYALVLSYRKRAK